MHRLLNRLTIRAKLGILTAVSLLGLIVVGVFLAISQYKQSTLDRQQLVRQG